MLIILIIKLNFFENLGILFVNLKGLKIRKTFNEGSNFKFVNFEIKMQKFQKIITKFFKKLTSILINDQLEMLIMMFASKTQNSENEWVKIGIKVNFFAEA